MNNDIKGQDYHECFQYGKRFHYDFVTTLGHDVDLGL